MLEAFTFYFLIYLFLLAPFLLVYLIMRIGKLIISWKRRGR